MAETYREDRDFQSAKEAYAQGRFAEARGLLAKVAERHPDEPEVLQQLGLCAFEYALQRVESDTTTPADWRAAIGHLEAALAASDDSKIADSLTVAHHNLGVCLNRQEAFEEARVEFRRALDLNPGMTEASVSLAINYADQREFSLAEELLREAIERSPDSLQARYTLGLVLSAQGKEAEAVEQFKAAQRLERDDVTLHYCLGVSYVNQDQLELAEEAFRQALELDPEFVPALYNLGLVLRNQGELAGAERCFEEVVRLDPDNPSGYFCLASLYERRDTVRAIPMWERYLDLASSRPSEAETVAKVARHVAGLGHQR